MRLLYRPARRRRRSLCLTLAVQAEGRGGDARSSRWPLDGVLNALQQAFQKHHALQCGFCTPGILMSFTDFCAHARHRRPNWWRCWAVTFVPVYRLYRHRGGAAGGRRPQQGFRVLERIPMRLNRSLHRHARTRASSPTFPSPLAGEGKGRG